MDTPAKRLQWARKEAGFDKPTEAARELGWTISTYLGHENGDRNPSRAAAKKYGRAFKVRWEWLLEGDGPPRAKGSPTHRRAGKIGAGAEVVPPEDAGEFEDVELPPGAPPNLQPVIVEGDSMYPRYFHGEKLYYIAEPRNPEDLIGRECVVKLADGRHLVKIVRKGSKRRVYNLESWNAPMMEDQSVEWAAPVRWRG